MQLTCTLAVTFPDSVLTVYLTKSQRRVCQTRGSVSCQCELPPIWLQFLGWSGYVETEKIVICTKSSLKLMSVFRLAMAFTVRLQCDKARMELTMIEDPVRR